MRVDLGNLTEITKKSAAVQNKGTQAVLNENITTKETPDKAHIGIQLRHGPRLLSENLSSLYSFSPHLKRAFRSCGKPLFPYVLRT